MPDRDVTPSFADLACLVISCCHSIEHMSIRVAGMGETFRAMEPGASGRAIPVVKEAIVDHRELLKGTIGKLSGVMEEIGNYLDGVDACCEEDARASSYAFDAVHRLKQNRFGEDWEPRRAERDSHGDSKDQESL